MYNMRHGECDDFYYECGGSAVPDRGQMDPQRGSGQSSVRQLVSTTLNTQDGLARNVNMNLFNHNNNSADDYLQLNNCGC